MEEAYLAKWKLFGKSKSKEEESRKEIDIPIQETEETLQTEQKIIAETDEETEESPIVEYHETLYSKEHVPKKGEMPSKTSSDSWKRRTWENVDTIEKNIDVMSKKEVITKSSTTKDMEKKVDSLIETKQGKLHRKPANVIYVVSKPQPGQVKGDWAVRSHGKIYSHHRQKENAIEAARKIARDKKATDLVQNTDGTFSEGFKPRTKK